MEIQWRNLDSLYELDQPLPPHYFMADTGVIMCVCMYACVYMCVHFMSHKTTSEETNGPIKGYSYDLCIATPDHPTQKAFCM